MSAVIDHPLELRTIVCLGRVGPVNVVLQNRDAVLLHKGRTFPNLTFDGFFPLIVRGITSINDCVQKPTPLQIRAVKRAKFCDVLTGKSF